MSQIQTIDKPQLKLNEANRFILSQHIKDKKNNLFRSEDEQVLIDHSTNEFDAMVNEVRAYISLPKGDTEEEKIEYNRMLNFAVLGHKKEKTQMGAIIKEAMKKKKWDLVAVPQSMGYQDIYEAVIANVIGLKVLDEIINSELWESVEELQVVDTDIYYIKRGDRFPTKYSSSFPKINDVRNLQENLVLYNEESINEQKPFAEVISPTGMRIAMTRPPLTQEYSISIRHDIETYYSFERLIELGTINEEMARFLEGSLHGLLTQIIIGPTGVGKSNLLQAYISEMNPNERFITIEDDWELNIRSKHPDRNVVQFQTLVDLNLTPKKYFKIGLRMRPSRIILPEIRDEEAREFINAVTRGHQGSITTGHISSIEDIPDAIASMAKQGDPNVDEIALRNRIAKFVLDLAIQMDFIGAERKITGISEIYLNEQNIVKEKKIFEWNRQENKWEFISPLSRVLARKIYNNSPKYYNQLINMGLIENVY